MLLFNSCHLGSKNYQEILLEITAGAGTDIETFSWPFVWPSNQRKFSKFTCQTFTLVWLRKFAGHLSDHELVYCLRKLNWKKGPAQMKTFRNYANYRSSEFRRDLAGIDWNLNSIDGQTASADELWDYFKTSFVSAADKHAPVIH